MSLKYKKCFMPHCRSSTTITPKKKFVHVPKNAREYWTKNTEKKYSEKTTLFCCEDHFDLKEDLVNWDSFEDDGKLILKRQSIPKLILRKNINMTNIGASSTLTESLNSSLTVTSTQSSTVTSSDKGIQCQLISSPNIYLRSQIATVPQIPTLSYKPSPTSTLSTIPNNLSISDDTLVLNHTKLGMPSIINSSETNENLSKSIENQPKPKIRVKDFNSMALKEFQNNNLTEDPIVINFSSSIQSNRCCASKEELDVLKKKYEIMTLEIKLLLQENKELKKKLQYRTEIKESHKVKVVEINHDEVEMIQEKDPIAEINLVVLTAVKQEEESILG